jgi:hypothetical protein
MYERLWYARKAGIAYAAVNGPLYAFLCRFSSTSAGANGAYALRAYWSQKFAMSRDVRNAIQAYGEDLQHQLSCVW